MAQSKPTHKDPSFTPTDSAYHTSPAESWFESANGTSYSSFFEHEMQAMASPFDSSPEEHFCNIASDQGDSSLFAHPGAWQDDSPLVTGPSGIDGPLFQPGSPLSQEVMLLPEDNTLQAIAIADTHQAALPLTASPQDFFIDPPAIGGAPQAAAAQLRHSVLPPATIVEEPRYPSFESLVQEMPVSAIPGETVKHESPPGSPTYSDDRLFEGRCAPTTSTKSRRLPRIDNGYPCSHSGCDRCFATRSDLNHHAQYHRPADLVCDVDGCGSRFPVRSQLRRHVETVHVDGSARKYHCHDCDVHTSRNDVFQRHIKTKKHLRRAAPCVELHQ